MALMTQKATDGSLLRFLASIDAILIEREGEIMDLQEIVEGLARELHKERFKKTLRGICRGNQSNKSNKI